MRTQKLLTLIAAVTPTALSLLIQPVFQSQSSIELSASGSAVAAPAAPAAPDTAAKESAPKEPTAETRSAKAPASIDSNAQAMNAYVRNMNGRPQGDKDANVKNESATGATNSTEEKVTTKETSTETQSAKTETPSATPGADTSKDASSASPGSTASPAKKLSPEELAAQKAAEEKKQIENTNAAVVHLRIARKYASKWQLGLALVELDASLMYDPTIKATHGSMCWVALLNGNIGRSLAEFCIVVGMGEAVPYTEAEKKQVAVQAALKHYDEALRLEDHFKWDDAIFEHEQALAFAPGDHGMQRSLAFCYASKGDFNNAEEFYALSFHSDPNDPFAHSDYAALLAEHGKQAQAEKQLAEAVRLGPRVAALHVDLGWAAEARGELAVAESQFQTAIKLSPMSSGLWYHLGRILERENKLDDAKQAYIQALALDPDATDLQAKIDGLSKLLPEKKAAPVTKKTT